MLSDKKKEMPDFKVTGAHILAHLFSLWLLVESLLLQVSRCSASYSVACREVCWGVCGCAIFIPDEVSVLYAHSVGHRLSPGTLIAGGHGNKPHSHKTAARS